jgi:hypothetical protein
MDTRAPDAGTVADTLYALELALARRDEGAIPGGYASVLDPAFLEFGQSGRAWTRAETLAVLSEAAPTDAPVIERFETELLAPGVVLVTYRIRAERDGHPVSSRRSSIWLRNDDGWRLRFHQGTTIPAGTDGEPA